MYLDKTCLRFESPTPKYFKWAELNAGLGDCLADLATYLPPAPGRDPGQKITVEVGDIIIYKCKEHRRPILLLLFYHLGNQTERGAEGCWWDGLKMGSKKNFF